MIDEHPLDREDDERYLIALLCTVTLRSLRDDALNRVAADDFGTGALGGIWDAAQRLRVADRPIDRRGLIAEAGIEAGPRPGNIQARETYVAHILDGLDGQMPVPHEYPRIVNSVITTGKLRRLVESLDRARQRAVSAEDFGSAYSAAVSEIEALAERDAETDGVTSLGDIVAALAEPFKHGPGDTVIPSPWPDFNDKAAGGLHRGRLLVIGARPGEGKSIAGHQAALHAASNGHPALVFSMEMGNAEVGGRMLASDTRIDMDEIGRLQLSQDSWRRYHEFAERSRSLPLWVVDQSNMTVDRITSIARTHKRRHGLDVMCVDYLQLMGMRGAASREQAVSEVARQLKNLARELDCCVLLPSQLNRETAKRGKPSLADLRESGGIEAHADLVLLLARQRFPENHDAAGQYNGRILLDIAKNRFGSTGELDLPWRGCYASIG